MRGYELTAYAKKDLIAIWRYTCDTWGEAQADVYLYKIETGFSKIAKGKILGKQPLTSYAKLQSVRCEHHYIFFLTGDKPIILAVLHEKMDFIARLKKRLADDS